NIFEHFISKNQNIYSKYMTNINYDNLKNSYLQVEKKDLKNFEYIKNIGKYNEIFINSMDNLGPLFFTEYEGYYISDFENSKNTFIISLNEIQLEKFKSYRNNLELTSNYKYVNKIKVGKIVGKFFFLKNISKELEVKEKIYKNLNSIKTESIDEYLNYDLKEHIKKQMNFDLSDIALAYEYKLDVYPPYLPKQASKASLVKEWEKFNKDIKGLLNREISGVKASIDELKNDKNILVRLFKEVKIKKLSSNIERLEKIKEMNFLSMKYKDIVKILEEITEINKNNTFDKNEIDFKIKESNIKKQIKEIDEKIQELEEESKIKEEKIRKSKTEISPKKNKMKNKGKNQSNNIENNLKQMNENTDNLEKELKVKKEKIKEFKEKKEKLKMEISSKENENKNQSNNIKNKLNISIPSNEINRVGNLYEYKGVTYLGILEEKDLNDIVFKEAKRLNAEIVFEK
ncbi:MAG: hypothetical protein ACRC1R_07985, partial [Cetobacterium sp.]|uniref:hypothetical protein n=1 Tax=Cetobacterium sp. TaxID=2071632 RepID=UPI003F34F34B